MSYDFRNWTISFDVTVSSLAGFGNAEVPPETHRMSVSIYAASAEDAVSILADRLQRDPDPAPDSQ